MEQRAQYILSAIGIFLGSALIIHGAVARNPETAVLSVPHLAIACGLSILVLTILHHIATSPRGTIIVNSALLVTVILLCLYCFELAASVFIGPACMTFKHCPYAQYHVENAEFAFNVTLNNEGYRMGEIPSRTVPLAVIGDSMVFGWGVEQSETIPTLLGATRNISVLNLGIEGAGPEKYTQIAQRFQGSADRFIVIYFSGNDVYEKPYTTIDRISPINDACSLWVCTLTYRAIGKTLNADVRGQPNPLQGKQRPASVDPRVWEAANNWSINPYLIAGALEQPSLANRYTNDLTAFATIHRNTDALHSLITALEGKPTLLVLLPANTAVSKTYQEALIKAGYDTTNGSSILCNSTLHEMIAKTVHKRENVTVLDLLPRMCTKEITTRDRLYFPLDGHLTATGHQWIVEQIQQSMSLEQPTIQLHKTQTAIQ